VRIGSIVCILGRKHSGSQQQDGRDLHKPMI
jgi:hypothetical protein